MFWSSVSTGLCTDCTFASTGCSPSPNWWPSTTQNATVEATLTLLYIHTEFCQPNHDLLVGDFKLFTFCAAVLFGEILQCSQAESDMFCRWVESIEGWSIFSQHIWFSRRCGTISYLHLATNCDFYIGCFLSTASVERFIAHWRAQCLDTLTPWNRDGFAVFLLLHHQIQCLMSVRMLRSQWVIMSY